LEDGLERTGMKSITQALMHICLSKTWGRLIGGYRSVETKNSTNNLGLSIEPKKKKTGFLEENQKRKRNRRTARRKLKPKAPLGITDF